MDEKFFVNKDYEAYNIYRSIRAHFHGRTGKGFDIKNSNYTANMPFAKYQAKSAIVIMFKKLTEKFQRQEVIDIIVSNFANGDKFGGQPFDSNAIDVYKDWKSGQEIADSRISDLLKMNHYTPSSIAEIKMVRLHQVVSSHPQLELFIDFLQTRIEKIFDEQ